MPASNFFGAITQGLNFAEQQEQQKLQRQQQLMALDDKRKAAIFQDARSVNSFLKSGQPERALGVLSDRMTQIEQLGGDPRDTKEVADLILQGDFNGAVSLLDSVEQAGVGAGFLKAPLDQREFKVQSSKVFDDGTILMLGSSGQRRVVSPDGQVVTGELAKNTIKEANKKVQDRKIALKNLDKDIKAEQSKQGVLTEQQKVIQGKNINRIDLLKNTSTGRNAAIGKAVKFKRALESGEAFSGAGRKAASFVPGVFSSQGQFDEEFNAFAEVAARQTLKASGETRPTDADVQGMKNAMFGIGRDESVNVQLLDDFINTQKQEEEELNQLMDAAKSQKLSDFFYTPSGAQLSDEDLLKKYGGQ